MSTATNTVQRKIERLAQQQAQVKTTDESESKRKAGTSRSLAIAKRGLTTGFDTINILTATITDVLEEDITTNQANVVVNAVGKVLKVVELQFKYGKPRSDHGGMRDLVLIGTGGAGGSGTTPVA